MSLKTLTEQTRKQWLNARVEDLVVDGSTTLNGSNVTVNSFFRVENSANAQFGQDVLVQGHFRGTAYYKNAGWGEYTQSTSFNTAVDVGDRKSFTVRPFNGSIPYDTNVVIPVTCAGIVNAESFVKTTLYVSDSTKLSGQLLRQCYTQNYQVGSFELVLCVAGNGAGTVDISDNVVYIYCEVIDTYDPGA
jgi:hypothetical protein